MSFVTVQDGAGSGQEWSYDSGVEPLGSGRRGTVFAGVDSAGKQVAINASPAVGPLLSLVERARLAACCSLEGAFDI